MMTTVPPVIGPPEGEIPVICGTEAADASPMNAGRRTIAMQIITHALNGRVILSDFILIWFDMIPADDYVRYYPAVLKYNEFNPAKMYAGTNKQSGKWGAFRWTDGPVISGGGGR
jgi:hypothetical protein